MSHRSLASSQIWSSKTWTAGRIFSHVSIGETLTRSRRLNLTQVILKGHRYTGSPSLWFPRAVFFVGRGGFSGGATLFFRRTLHLYPSRRHRQPTTITLALTHIVTRFFPAQSLWFLFWAAEIGFGFREIQNPQFSAVDHPVNNLHIDTPSTWTSTSFLLKFSCAMKAGLSLSLSLANVWFLPVQTRSVLEHLVVFGPNFSLLFEVFSYGCLLSSN